jgi:phosphoribulokinase
MLAAPGPDISLAHHHACNRLRSVVLMRRSPIIVGIAGDSGSGKTTYTDGIRRMLGPSMVTTIEMDGYHSENRQQRARTGHLPLDPAYNRLDLLAQHLSSLKRGESVEIPTYDHRRGDFGQPRRVSPTPVIIVEGLHALYDQLLPFMNYTVFVDPDRAVKYRWKYRRDVIVRGHAPQQLEDEMVAREALFKRFIDFQKISASTVIQIRQSDLLRYASYEYTGPDLSEAYHMTLILENRGKPLPALPLTLTMSAIAGGEDEAFMIATAPSRYWGKKATTVTIDGFVPQAATDGLSEHITDCTGISPEEGLPVGKMIGHLPSIQFAQLLIAWTFLEQAYRLSDSVDQLV